MRVSLIFGITMSATGNTIWRIRLILQSISMIVWLLFFEKMAAEKTAIDSCSNNTSGGCWICHNPRHCITLC